jgi:hypothetical protein
VVLRAGVSGDGGSYVPRNVFDQAARYLIQSDPLGFLRWILRSLDPALRFHGWLDTRTLPFPGTPDRICDTVAELAESRAGGPRFAVITEFQTEPETEILDRALEYLSRLRRELRHGPDRRGKFTLVAALVNLTGPAQTDTLELTLPGCESAALRFQVATRTLREEDAAQTLEAIAAGTASRCLLGWISLMRGGGDPDIIERWKTIAGAEPDGGLRATYGAIVTLFAELTDCVAAWKAGLEGWNMRESTVVAEWKAEALAEGLAKGLAQGERNALLLVLGQKFQTPVPADLVAAIENQADVDVLSLWLTTAVAAGSLAAFRTATGI